MNLINFEASISGEMKKKAAAPGIPTPPPRSLTRPKIVCAWSDVFKFWSNPLHPLNLKILFGRFLSATPHRHDISRHTFEGTFYADGVQF